MAIENHDDPLRFPLAPPTALGEAELFVGAVGTRSASVP